MESKTWESGIDMVINGDAGVQATFLDKAMVQYTATAPSARS